MAKGPKSIPLNNDYDIYRLTKVVNPSPEHIIHAGLGGELEVLGLIDHKTNNDFGGTIDKDLVEDFSWLRARIGLTTRRGDPIRVVTNSAEFDILGDSPLVKKRGRPWEVSQDASGQLHIKISADTLERAMAFKEHAIRALSLKGKPIQEFTAKKVRTYAPATEVNVEIGGPVALRSLAKCCLNALAFRIIPQRVLDEAFNEIRSYIVYGIDSYDTLKSGKEDPHRPLACFDPRNHLFRPLPENLRTGSPLEHRLVLRGCADVCVYATIELFGQIPFSVLMTDKWQGTDFCWAYVVDPVLGGKGHIRYAAPLDARPNLTAEEVLRHTLDLTSLKPRLDQVVSLSGVVARQRYEDRIVKETVVEVLAQAEEEGIKSSQMILERIRDSLTKTVIEDIKRERKEEDLKLDSLD